MVTMLAKWVLMSDPYFTYTSVTINKNYAANKHRDSSHEGGLARIMAFGDFTGGELWHERKGYAEPRQMNVNGRFYDFDARELHATMPFTGTKILSTIFILRARTFYLNFLLSSTFQNRIIIL